MEKITGKQFSTWRKREDGATWQEEAIHNFESPSKSYLVFSI